MNFANYFLNSGQAGQLPPYRSQQWSQNRGRTVYGPGNPALKYYMQQPKENELFFGPKYKRIEKPLITENDDVCEENKINTALPGRQQRLVSRQGQRIDYEDSITYNGKLEKWAIFVPKTLSRPFFNRVRNSVQPPKYP